MPRTEATVTALDPTEADLAEQFRLETRRARADDRVYLQKTWLKAFAPTVGPLHNATFEALHKPIVDELLERSDVFVAHPAGDDATILGFIVAEAEAAPMPLVHWLYVRANWRCNGIARSLAQAAGVSPEHVVFTHWSDSARTLVRKFRGLVYYPYAVGAP